MEQTQQPVAVQPLSSFEIQLLTFLDQRYQLTGKLISAEEANRQYGIPQPKFNTAIKNPKFKEALEERGIVFERYHEEAWVNTSLTPTQLLLANSLLDTTDTRSIKKKCQDSGVSTIKYEAWLRDPVFKQYLMDRAEQKLGNAHHEADLALLDRIRAGDMKAIAYYNEMTGRYVQQTYRGNQNIDAHALIVQILEIIDENVKDPTDQMAVSQALRGLIARHNAANVLTGQVEDNDGIVVPEVAPMAKLPELNAEAPSSTTDESAGNETPSQVNN